MKLLDYLVIAKPYHCVPAALESTLRYFGVNDFTQETLGSYFGIGVPDDCNIEAPYITRTSDVSKWGVVIGSDSLNRFFVDNELPLRETFISIHTVYDECALQKIISDEVCNHKVLMCGYNYSALHGHDSEEFGHVSIILGVSSDKAQIELMDPGPKNPGGKFVKAEDLFYAIRKKRDGLWVIGSRE